MTVRIVDRRTWRRVEAEPPELPELPLARYCRERRELAAAQIRWATDIVDLDDDQGRPVTARYERRQRIKKRLSRVRVSLAHALADAALCSAGFTSVERDGIAADIAAIEAMCRRLNAAITG
jgi:hypothetical protein